jgi:hypothetical protein
MEAILDQRRRFPSNTVLLGVGSAVEPWNAHAGDVVEDRVRRPDPGDDVDQDRRGARDPPQSPGFVQEHAEALIARAWKPETIGFVADPAADLRNRELRVVAADEGFQKAR